MDVGAFIVTGENVMVDPNGKLTLAGQAEAVDVAGVHDEFVAHDDMDPRPVIEDENERPLAVTNVPFDGGDVWFATEYTPSPNSTGPTKPFIAAAALVVVAVHCDVTVTVNGPQAAPGSHFSGPL